MKTKATATAFNAKLRQTTRTKGSGHLSRAIDPLSKARPFLVHALRLRPRKPAR